MQTLVQVICNRSQTSSLRQKIVKDKNLENFNLTCVAEKKNSRPDGWAKLKSKDDSNGAINIQWDMDTKTLSARIISKNKIPSTILSNFVEYIFSTHNKNIKALNIYPIE